MWDWLMSFPNNIHINIVDPIDKAIDYMLLHWNAFFDGLAAFLRAILKGVGTVVKNIPWWALLIIVFALALITSKKVIKSLLYTVLLFFIGTLGLWSLMNDTLTTVITSVLLSLLLGFPIGILLSQSRGKGRIMRPILDTMQTMPSFVYLIPAVMFMGLGDVPAVIATMVYAMPPIIRMTNHGLRQVDKEVLEAAQAFGSTRAQTLFKVQIPQAMPTIMTGVNQTIMMAISMVVTCSMIGATGLGAEVIAGINRLESGRGFAAGIAIVIIAIIMDRITQGLFKKKK